MKVRRSDQEGTEAERDWIVAATQFDPTKSESAKLLVVKSGEQPAWVDGSTVKGNWPDAAQTPSDVGASLSENHSVMALVAGVALAMGAAVTWCAYRLRILASA
jgi:hypothetical protein